MIETLFAYAATVEVSTLVYSVGTSVLAGVGSNIVNHYWTKSATKAKFEEKIKTLEAKIAATEGQTERDIEIDKLEVHQQESISAAHEESHSYLSKAYETATHTISTLKTKVVTLSKDLLATKAICHEQSEVITELTEKTGILADIVESKDQELTELKASVDHIEDAQEEKSSFKAGFFGS